LYKNKTSQSTTPFTDEEAISKLKARTEAQLKKQTTTNTEKRKKKTEQTDRRE
jgi:hypothetical protein